MWPLLAHQNPGRTGVLLVDPEETPGKGCWGDRGSMRAQAAVPGSSDPSGQSQVLSLTRSTLSLMVGSVMQLNCFLSW